MYKVEDPLEQIKSDIEKKFYMACATLASDTTFLIESAYESIIDSFYDDYTPRVYNRTYSTYLLSDRYNDPFGFDTVDDNIFNSGIVVDSDNITGNPYRADKDWVTGRTFEQGIHGFFAWEYKRWAQERWRRLNKKYVMGKNRKNKLREYFTKTYKHSPQKYSDKKTVKYVDTTLKVSSFKADDDAWAKMINEAYNSTETQTVKFTYNLSGWHHVSPKRYMDREFKEITRKSAMNKRFHELLDSYFA